MCHLRHTAVVAALQAYRRMLGEASTRLQKAKTDFKDDLLNSLNEFNNNVANMRSEFLRNAPFTADVPSANAYELISEFKAQCAAVRSKETDMRAGLDIFSIEPPANTVCKHPSLQKRVHSTRWYVKARRQSDNVLVFLSACAVHTHSQCPSLPLLCTAIGD